MADLEIKDLTLRFGGIVALSDVSFYVTHGQIHALIGPNGAGKTSVFNVISGIYKPSGGQVIFDGHPITYLKPYAVASMGVARTFQNIELFRHISVIDNLLLGRHQHMVYWTHLCSGFLWSSPPGGSRASPSCRRNYRVS